MKRNLLTLVLAIILSVLHCIPLLAQVENKAENSAYERISHLVSIKKNIIWLQNEIKNLQQDLKDEISADLKTQLEKDLSRLRERYRKAKANFSEIAAGIHLDSARAIESQKRDLLKEVQELISPLLNSFRRLSERPRKIERLKSEIPVLKEKISLFEKASTNINALIKYSDNQKILNDLIKEKEDAERMLEGLRINLEIIQRQLLQETSSDKSFIETGTEVIKDFFRNRGKNLFFALLSLFSIWWVMSALRSRIFKANIFPEPLAWAIKPLKALYSLISILMAIIGTIICLYLLNDWVLLTFVILILSAFAWTSRQWIPKFLQEGRLILNLGTVREGERIIWQGVPFLVRDLAFYSTLINNQLQGGHLKVAAAELIGRHSRPVVQDEPWFPTNKGDWVLLSDDTYGKVQIQTPEQVMLQIRGGTNKFYSTADFLAQRPRNLSNGFRIVIEFGLDYGVQSRICREIPEIFLKGIKAKLGHRLSGDDPDFTNLKVEFHSAGESSLKLWVKANSPGRIAYLYLNLYREMQATLVDICNDNRFVIPFNQLTVHMPEKG